MFSHIVADILYSLIKGKDESFMSDDGTKDAFSVWLLVVKEVICFTIQNWTL